MVRKFDGYCEWMGKSFSWVLTLTFGLSWTIYWLGSALDKEYIRVGRGVGWRGAGLIGHRTDWVLPRLPSQKGRSPHFKIYFAGLIFGWKMSCFIFRGWALAPHAFWAPSSPAPPASSSLPFLSSESTGTYLLAEHLPILELLLFRKHFLITKCMMNIAMHIIIMHHKITFSSSCSSSWAPSRSWLPS